MLPLHLLQLPIEINDSDISPGDEDHSGGMSAKET